MPTIFDTSKGATGHYKASYRLVPAGTTTAGILWEFRWAPATPPPDIAVITSIRLSALQIAAPTAAVNDIFNIKVARSFSVADTTGSVAVAPGAGMNKLTSGSATSAVNAIRQSNAAGGATGGTKTLDTDPIARGEIWVMAALSAASGSPVLVCEFSPDIAEGESPLVLATSEGFAVSNENAFGAASGIVLQLDINWSELDTH